MKVSKIGSVFGKHRGDPGWDFRTDLDGDGVISILDIAREAAYDNSTSSTLCWAQRTEYVYDGLGNLVKRTSTDVSTAPSPYIVTWTEYIDGLYEVTNTGAVTKYYGAFGRAIAVRQVPTGTGAGTLTYLLADHLGSTVGALDAAGNVIATQNYWPFGATRSGSIAQTDKLYTGQQQEATGALQDATNALGTYFYHARFRGTVTGRFLSADSVTRDGLNRFSYVANNPLRYVDPSGRGLVGIPGPGCREDVPGDGSCDPAPPPCDVTCAQGVEAICAANPSSPGCGGSPTPAPMPDPTPTTPTPTPLAPPTPGPVPTQTPTPPPGYPTDEHSGDNSGPTGSLPEWLTCTGHYVLIFWPIAGVGLGAGLTAFSGGILGEVGVPLMSLSYGAVARQALFAPETYKPC